MKLTRARMRIVLLGILVIYATAIAPLLGSDKRNYLVIVASFMMVGLSLLIRNSKSQSVDLLWISAAMFYSLVLTLFIGSISELSTVGYTVLFSLTWFAFSKLLDSRCVDREDVARFLRAIVYAYCAVSLLQIATALVGLPVPNQILSKGVWSQNSLAVEPSHAGRALAMTLLAYLTITKGLGHADNVFNLLRKERKILTAFMISIFLTGSAAALIAAPIAVILSLRGRSILVMSLLVFLTWPLLFLVDNPELQRSLNFLVALPSMDIETIVRADQSGAMRVMPFLLYFDHYNLLSMGSIFGEGVGAIASYVKGRLVGAGDLVAAGFIPGYLISFGLVGTFLLLFTFVFRFLNIVSLPIILLWIVLFTTSAWNSQLFWYGLMLLRLVHHFSLSEPSAHMPRQRKKSIGRRSLYQSALRKQGEVEKVK